MVYPRELSFSKKALCIIALILLDDEQFAWYNVTSTVHATLLRTSSCEAFVHNRHKRRLHTSNDIQHKPLIPLQFKEAVQDEEVLGDLHDPLAQVGLRYFPPSTHIGHENLLRNGHSDPQSSMTDHNSDLSLLEHKKHIELHSESEYYFTAPGNDNSQSIITMYDEEKTISMKNESQGSQLKRKTRKENRLNLDTSEKPTVTLRSLWRHRQARSAEEGIRREKTSKLSDVLNQARGSMMEIENRKANTSRRFAARTITGFINALAEEVDGLDVQVSANPKTPLWKKQVDAITINFSRLGFKPLHISGGVLEPGQKTHHFQARSLLGIYDDFVADTKKWSSPFGTAATQGGPNISNKTVISPQELEASTNLTSPLYKEARYKSPTADEAFDRIDVDNSGFLDRDELIQALKLAAIASFEDVDDDNKHIIEKLASDLFELYDLNGDGVVDRKEYKSMVSDMATLRQKQIEQQYQRDQEDIRKQQKAQRPESQNKPWFSHIWKPKKSGNETRMMTNVESNKPTRLEVLDSKELVDSVAKTLGSITISDVKLDLRQLLFGAVPVIKRITPGGPLVLEPFTVTINGSFDQKDIVNSALLDAGLRRLVARVLRIRVGFVRDFLEGAVFYGRSWNMFGESGPKVEVPELTEIEFDKNNKLIITGRARVRTSPSSPVVNQAFKVRTSIGTRQNGRFIRLEEPELALVVECPKSWERNIGLICDALNIRKQVRPKPLYTFFPIYSPFKLNDDGGFDLGEDNTINSLYINDGRLCFEMSSVLRPGRFLGSHYLAFSIPNRTFIVTLDRVTEAIRAARKTKKAADALRRSSTRRSMKRRRKRSVENSVSSTSVMKKNVKSPKVRGFFARFVDGYLQAEREEPKKESVTTAIRDFFGRQGTDLVRPPSTIDFY